VALRGIRIYRRESYYAPSGIDVTYEFMARISHLSARDTAIRLYASNKHEQLELNPVAKNAGSCGKLCLIYTGNVNAA